MKTVEEKIRRTILDAARNREGPFGKTLRFINTKMGIGGTDYASAKVPENVGLTLSDGFTVIAGESSKNGSFALWGSVIGGLLGLVTSAVSVFMAKREGDEDASYRVLFSEGNQVLNNVTKWLKNPDRQMAIQKMGQQENPGFLGTIVRGIDHIAGVEGTTYASPRAITDALQNLANWTLLAGGESHASITAAHVGSLALGIGGLAVDAIRVAFGKENWRVLPAGAAQIAYNFTVWARNPASMKLFRELGAMDAADEVASREDVYDSDGNAILQPS